MTKTNHIGRRTLLKSAAAGVAIGALAAPPSRKRSACAWAISAISTARR